MSSRLAVISREFSVDHRIPLNCIISQSFLVFFEVDIFLWLFPPGGLLEIIVWPHSQAIAELWNMGGKIKNKRIRSWQKMLGEETEETCTNEGSAEFGERWFTFFCDLVFNQDSVELQ